MDPQAAPLPDPRAIATKAGVLIRAAEPSDVPDLHATMDCPNATRGTLQVPYTSLAAREARFTFTDDPHIRFLVAEPLDGGPTIGNIGLHRNTRPRRIHTASLGMSVHDDWVGRGVGSALMAAALDVADNWWQVRRVHLDVFADNEPAIALYRKFGFEVEGTLRQDAFRDGAYVDTLVMARLVASR